MGKAIFGLFLIPCLVLAQSLDVRFTNPKCSKYPDKPQNAFCTRADLPSSQSNPEGPFQKIIDLIRQKDNVQITLGTMSFSNKFVAKELCAAIKRGVNVQVLVDAGVPLETTTEVENCGGHIYKIGTTEQEGQRGDLHHNKFLLAEKSKENVLVVSTGNFSNPALSINHETWTFIKLRGEFKILKDHQCLIQALKQYQNEMNQFSKNLRVCRESKTALSSEKVESFFVPTDSKKLIDLISQQMRSSKYVLMTSNRYSYDAVTSAFQTNKSANRRAIFDDDLYWGGLQPTEDYINEALDAKKIAKLEKIIPVRYLQTSYGAAQKMHNKFIVFDSMVIVGAGNYTFAGLTSNFENFYLIKDQEIVDKFKQQFEYLWSISTDRLNMPRTYSDPGKTP